MYDEIHDFKHKKDFDTEDGFKDAVQKEPYCLVLEYLSYPLEALDPEQYKQNPVFMAAFFKSMLMGTRSLKEAEAIWSGESRGSTMRNHGLMIWQSCTELTAPLDGKLENMLCSNVDSSSPDIKISDLGLCKYRSPLKMGVPWADLLLMQAGQKAMTTNFCSLLRRVRPRFGLDWAVVTLLIYGLSLLRSFAG